MPRKLTDRFVERLQPESGLIRVWDAEVKGFGVRVSSGGRKSYIFRFTRKGSKIQATLGSAEGWSCDDARDRAIPRRSSTSWLVTRWQEWRGSIRV